jgi:type I restriction enzyme, S subunit
MVWEVKKLGDVCEIGDGNHSSKYPKKKEMRESGIPFIRCNNIVDGHISGINMKYISEEKHLILKKGHLKAGDILFSNRGEIGKVGIVDKEFDNSNLNSQLAWFRCSGKVFNKFLFYVLQTPELRNYYFANKTGSALQQFPISKIKKLKIPVPPLSIQKKIVKILDEAFEKLSKAKENAETNLNNSKEVFESYLQSVFENKGEDWEEKKLKELTLKIGSGATPKGGQASYKETGTSLIRSMNVHDEGFKEKNLAHIDDEQASKLNNVTIEENDVLLNITGASVARCCIVPNDYLPARVNQHVSIIRLRKELLNHNFLHYALISKKYKKNLLGIGEQGSTRQAITKAQIENFKISYPKTIEEQKLIVEKIHSICDKCLNLNSIYTQKLVDLEELKKSILQKAFKGQLTKGN